MTGLQRFHTSKGVGHATMGDTQQTNKTQAKISQPGDVSSVNPVKIWTSLGRLQRSV